MSQAVEVEIPGMDSGSSCLGVEQGWCWFPKLPRGWPLPLPAHPPLGLLRAPASSAILSSLCDTWNAVAWTLLAFPVSSCSVFQRLHLTSCAYLCVCFFHVCLHPCCKLLKARTVSWCLAWSQGVSEQAEWAREGEVLAW